MYEEKGVESLPRKEMVGDGRGCSVRSLPSRAKRAVVHIHSPRS